ncbi:hypothetical protein ICN28_06225 [Polynucleobacter sp. 30F-ANTBAC]|uniref:hypothetical protein n=1 Tax=Polynucleobacter sp. 30F-ANTBAC TaxID=2689095 RepID=UPI001C0BE154|nr:hypothetical protein [Polynucleobacter sp. 30F-ANTBAC]MBU3600109.1 hypothetical protein [Polynucleobacter sp. 30F-ANTBAC]
MSFVDKLKTPESKKYLRNWLIYGFFMGLLGVTTPYTGKPDIDWSYFPVSLLEGVIFSLFCFPVFIYLNEREKEKNQATVGVRSVWVTGLIAIFIVKVASVLLAFSMGFFN